MARLDKARFMDDIHGPGPEKDLALRKLLLGGNDKSRTALLKAFKPVIESVASEFAKNTKDREAALPQTKSSFMKVVDEASDFLKRYNGNIKVIGLGNYVESQLWRTMKALYKDKGLLGDPNPNGRGYKEQ